MISFPQLIKKVLTLYATHFKTLFPLLALSIIWNIALGVTFVSIPESFRLLFPVMAGSLLVSAITELLLVNAFVHFEDGTLMRIREIITKSLKNLPWFLLLLVLWGIFIIVGLTFLVIPGIIFATWFMFWPTVFVVEHGRGFSVFHKSKALVAGHFFPLLLQASTTFLGVFFIINAAGQGFFSLGQLVIPPEARGIFETISHIFNSTISALGLPIVTGTIVTLYYEMRKIKAT